MSTRTERTEAIEVLKNEFTGASGIYLTNVNNIKVEKMTMFRKSLRNVGVKYIVVKNTLAQKAFEKCGFNDLIPFLKGPIGIAITKDDATSPSRVIKDFRKENKKLLDIKVAYVEGNLFNAEETNKLADLPGREVLLSQLLSCLNAPMTNFVCSLSGLFTKLVGTLEAVKNKKETE